MSKIPDTSKIASKFNLQEIIKNVQSIISPTPEIPEEAKKDPIGYRLSELTKSIKTLEDLNTLLGKEIGKIGAMLGSLYKDWSEQKSSGNIHTTSTTMGSSIPTETSTKDVESNKQPSDSTTDTKE